MIDTSSSGHKGYDADAIRDEIASADIEAVIPATSNRREPIPHDKANYYKWRNQIRQVRRILPRFRRNRCSQIMDTLWPRALEGVRRYACIGMMLCLFFKQMVNEKIEQFGLA